MQLYEKSNQPDKAAEWKAKLDALNSDNTQDAGDN